MLDRSGQRLDELGRLTGRLRRAVQLLVEAAAAHELQRDVGLALVLADLEDLHDVGVLQPRHRRGLGPEARQLVRLGLTAGADHLEGDDAVELHLPGLVDDAHAAPPQLPQDLIVRDGRQRGGLCRPGRDEPWARGRLAAPGGRGRGRILYGPLHLEQVPDLGGPFGETTQVLLQFDPLADLPAEQHLVADQVQRRLDVGPQPRVLRQVHLRQHTLPARPAGTLVEQRGLQRHRTGLVPTSAGGLLHAVALRHLPPPARVPRRPVRRTAPAASAALPGCLPPRQRWPPSRAPPDAAPADAVPRR